jgi:hypothetical protein
LFPVKNNILIMVTILLFLIFSGGCASLQPGESNNDTHANQEKEMVKGVHENGIDLSSLPDNPALNEVFIFEDSLVRMRQIKEALNSFKKLTEQSKNKLNQDALENIGNTSWEIQYLGFHNWAGTVEGTLRKQYYLIKKLELDLATRQYAAGEINVEEFREKETAYLQTKDDFQQFIDEFSIAD